MMKPKRGRRRGREDPSSSSSSPSSWSWSDILRIAFAGIAIELVWLNGHRLVRWNPFRYSSQFLVVAMDQPSPVSNESNRLNIVSTSNRTRTHLRSPFLVTSVITFDRAQSLRRCLESLQNAHYPPSYDVLSALPLKIQLDAQKKKKKGDASLQNRRQHSLALAESFPWTHGPKQLHVRARNAGLVGQWFEAWTPLPGDDYWISIVEDDLEYSPYYFQFLLDMEEHLQVTALTHNSTNDYDDSIASICLSDAGQWHKNQPRRFVRVAPTDLNQIRYTCSWGALWKASAFRKFQHWLHANLDAIEPYTNKPFNIWIREKRDLQSVWTARYWKEHPDQKFLVFDLKRNSNNDKAWLVVNHREAGLNARTKLKSDSSLLMKDPSFLPTPDEWKQARQSIREQLAKLQQQRKNSPPPNGTTINSSPAKTHLQ